MWSATVGAIPVNWFTWAASAIFSYGSRGTPCWAKTLKRVPELPNAHDGSSIRWDRSAATTAWLLVTSASVARRGGCGRMPRCVPIVRAGWGVYPTRRRRHGAGTGGAGAQEDVATGSVAAKPATDFDWFQLHS